MWQDRQFVLCEDGFLEWYKAEGQGVAVGMLPVSHILEVREDAAKKTSFTIVVKSDRPATFELDAKDADTASKWVRSLKLLTAGNKQETMEDLHDRYWRDINQMRVLRLQRSNQTKFNEMGETQQSADSGDFSRNSTGTFKPRPPPPP